MSSIRRERISMIGFGYTTAMATVDDVPLVLLALIDPDGPTGDFACLAIEKMAPQNLFEAPDVEAALRGLLPKLRSPDHDTSEWSSRAVGALAKYTTFVVGEGLAEAFAEMLLMVEGSQPEIRRRGLALASVLLPLVGGSEREQAVMAVLGACRRGVAGEADGRAYSVGIRALGCACRLIEGEKLAREAAEELLSVVEGGQIDRSRTVLVDLASLAHRTGEPLRGRIVQAIIAAAEQWGYCYCPRGSMPGPARHSGADALAVVAPLLDRQQLQEAHHAVASQAKRVSPVAHESAYGIALAALGERDEVLRRAT